jgi:hypothetical protein
MSPLNPWTTVPGAEALQEIYGYWPNLHDAVLRELRLSFTDSSATALLDYERVRLTLRWDGVSAARLRLADGGIYGVALTRREDGIETCFEDYEWGLQGTIRAAALRVENVVDAPEKSGDAATVLTLGTAV